MSYFKAHRQFVTVKQLAAAETKNTFRVMTYNILTPIESYLVWQQYCPAQYRKWSYRLPRIMAQIIAFYPDIVCLQETSVESFETSLKSEFHALEYEAWHEQRGSNPAADHSQAIFWKKAVFAAQNKKMVRFRDLCQQTRYEKYIGRQDDSNALFKKVKSLNDVAMFLHLRHIASSKHLVVVCSHFFWDPAWEDVKLLQCLMLNAALHEVIVSEWKLEIADVSIVFGVDANSFPFSSGVYQLMIDGTVGRQHAGHPMQSVRSRLTKQGDEMELKKQTECVREVGAFCNDAYGKMQWKSAYCLDGKEPLFTNKSASFEGTLDYLFYCGAGMRVLRYLELPFCNAAHKREFGVETDEQCAGKFEYFPNDRYPSDHIALVADMQC